MTIDQLIESLQSIRHREGNINVFKVIPSTKWDGAPSSHSVNELSTVIQVKQNEFETYLAIK